MPKPQGGLSMAGRLHLIDGGSRGPAIVPGDASASLIADVLSHAGELSMPPSGPLADHERQALLDWIDAGAAWPEGLLASELDSSQIVPRHFQRIVEPSVPDDTSAGPDAGPIDSLVAAELDAVGLTSAPRADPRTLLRRLSFDLTGLPPTAAELEAFAADPSEAAYEQAVERLLTSPAFGERLGRLWLDVVRYADSDGFERDGTKPYAWRYRDWVVDAFNADLPYDRFLAAQLAGDQRPDLAPNGLIATGFWRLHAWDDEPNDPAQAEFDELDDSLRTITEGMLGVTVGCARCHDHRFDPLPQRDYYGLLAYFRGVARYEEPHHALDSPVLRPVDAGLEALERWREQREGERARIAEQYKQTILPWQRVLVNEQLNGPRRARALAVLDQTRDEPLKRTRSALSDLGIPTDLDALERVDVLQRLPLFLQLADLDPNNTLDFKGELDWALVVTDGDGPPPETHLLGRGQASNPLETVPPSTPAAIELAAPAPGDALPSRSTLADWVTDPGNPLTPRVWANRLWQLCFGVGLVSTPDDFGNSGEPASHPELLDYLALRLVEGDWSTKALLRELLLSEAYRRASNVSDPMAEELDPDARLLWRQRPRRLESEMVRDAMLAATGELDTSLGGPPVHPRIERQALAGQSRPGNGWRPEEDDATSRRSLYVAVRRGIELPLHALFDRPPPVLPSGRRAVTTTAPQALHLLNGAFAGQRARALAAAVLAEAPDDRDLAIDQLFARVLDRRPSDAERAAA
ncbi:MAG: PSD1 and planctomycete cytochrome C domain-containing protein, partial [Planctomycetota bacterium]